MKSFIQAISCHLPERVLTNTELAAAHPGWNMEELTCITGVHERHISDEGEISSDLALKSAEKLFQEHQIDPGNIDYLLFCTQTGDYIAPSSACILQDKLGIPSTAGALDINQGCTGYLYGLGLAKGLIETGQAKKVLFLTAETISKLLNPLDKSSVTLFGDGSAATLVSACPDDSISHIGNFEYGTDGSGYANIIQKYGGARHPYKGQVFPDFTDHFGNIRNEGNFYMNGTAVFLFANRTFAKTIRQVLLKNKLQLEDIDHFVFHQASRFVLEAVIKKMELPPEKVHTSLGFAGNTVASSIPVTFSSALAVNKIKRNDKVLLAAVGVGWSWAATVITF